MEGSDFRKFEHVVGKPVPRELTAALAAGMEEVYRLKVRGGVEIFLARPRVAQIQVGEEKPVRVRLYILPEMPSGEALEGGLAAHAAKSVVMTAGDGKPTEGTYGVVQGRKYFVPGAGGFFRKERVSKSRRSASA